MTGGSLGLRTGSYGSLQQPIKNSALLPIQTSPVILRKPSKMLPSGPREREKFRSWIWRSVGRRKIGMLLVGLICGAVLMSVLSTFTKDEDSREAMDAQPGSTQYVHTLGSIGRVVSSHYESPLISGQQDSYRNNNSSSLEILSPSGENTTLPPVVIMVTLPPVHPCENFAFPPPPADKKRIGPRPCPVCYVPVEQAIAYMPSAPSVSPVLQNLTYVFEENPISNQPFGGSIFGGYPSLEQRNESYDIKESMSVYCGFVRGNKPGHQTGFDMDDADLLEMEQCRGVVVASAIFGNYDIIQQPKNISEFAKRNACFYMFVDEETEAYMKNSSTLDSTKRIGLWRIGVVRNLPYVDARRNGKVPKLLLHRIFPNARFSIWIDGKLELIMDPYQILERFLWRQNVTFAISKHYRRFDVFEEAAANKAAGKYDNSSIDYQVEFYRQEGLTPYTEQKLPIASDVPEGCVIIREHTPITNLFTCLWFNEVDRFTSRDQLSFAIVRDKIMSKVNWNLDMFLDCERRNFVVQVYHKDIMEQKNTIAAMIHPPPLALPNRTPRKALPDIVVETMKTPVKKIPLRRGREKRLGSRRHRSRAANGRDNNSF